jgi:hypothetical protein
VRNVVMRLEADDKLHLEIDLTATIGRTKSGNELVASSRGQVQIPDEAGGLRPEQLTLAVWRPTGNEPERQVDGKYDY